MFGLKRIITLADQIRPDQDHECDLALSTMQFDFIFQRELLGKSDKGQCFCVYGVDESFVLSKICR